MHDKLKVLFSNRYPALRSQYPNLGRRKWQLKAIQELWDALSKDPNAINALNISEPPPDADSVIQDPDPFDTILDGPEQGLLLRTDFSNDEAWQSFSQKVATAEQELAEAMKPDEEPSATQTEASTSSAKMDIDNAEAEDESDSSEDEGELPGPVIKIIDLPEEMRSSFENMSNLAALHLLNDVDIRPAPGPPKGQKQYRPQNPLVDQGGWQEIYSGKSIWIYDFKSNTDQCVRLVSQEGDVYGTATGDSWRVQGGHICELQFNMSFLGMKINFGGLDRWDLDERKRNLDQAQVPI